MRSAWILLALGALAEMEADYAEDWRVAAAKEGAAHLRATDGAHEEEEEHEEEREDEREDEYEHEHEDQEQYEHDLGEMHDEMDTNKDGTLTMPELESSLKEWLWQDVGEKIDTAEEPFGLEKEIKKLVEDSDKDKDGAISTHELEGFINKAESVLMTLLGGDVVEDYDLPEDSI